MTSTSALLAEFTNISKCYGTKQAVKEVSFSVRSGEIVGLLGPNGAGKSTSMKILTGCIEASSGEVAVSGHSLRDSPQRAQRDIGYLPESTPLYAEWTVREFLVFVAHSRGIKAVKESVERALERSGLQTVHKQLIGTLSKGYRQRTCFAQSIIHDPPLLVLDEATDGLDPNQKKSMQQFIKEMGREKGILFSTHILSEAEAVCDRILVLNAGEMVYDGDVKGLIDRGTMQSQFILTVEGERQDEVCSRLMEISEIRKVEAISSAEGETTVSIVTGADPSGGQKERTPVSLLIAERACENNWPIIELKQEKASMNAAFESVTR